MEIIDNWIKFLHIYTKMEVQSLYLQTFWLGNTDYLSQHSCLNFVLDDPDRPEGFSREWQIEKQEYIQLTRV